MQLGRLEPCRPLTTRPGSWAPIPGTLWRVQLFPTQLRFLGPAQEVQICDLPLAGPVVQWTAQLDLEDHSIRIWGMAQQRFLFRLALEQGGICLTHLLPSSGSCAPQLLVAGVKGQGASPERLQFGQHAIQDVERKRSHHLAHVIPTWFRLGSALEPNQADPAELSLLGGWALAVEQSNRSAATRAIQALRQIGFQDLWAPQSVDHQMWGYTLPPTTHSPFHVLSAGAALLRRMVIDQQGPSCTLLPLLPKELPAGRLLQAQWPGVGSLDLEFSRGLPRRLLLRPEVDGSIQLVWEGEKARVRPVLGSAPSADQERILASGEPLEVVAGRTLLLDRFWSS